MSSSSSSSPSSDGVRLLISNELGVSRAAGPGRLVCLCHPKSGRPTCYILNDGILQELNWLKQSHGSWFVGDHVYEDGSLYIATTVDPIFVLLPIFLAARMTEGSKGLFKQLDEILFVDGYPNYQCLISMAESCMHLVCETKEMSSSKFFRLDDSKVVDWLLYKVHCLDAALTKLDKNYAVQQEENRLREAISLLGEYIKDEPWATLLCNRLQLNSEDVCFKEPRNNNDTPPASMDPASCPKQGNSSLKKAPASSGKQAKKTKNQINSQNIGDMFRRASKRRTG